MSYEFWPKNLSFLWNQISILYYIENKSNLLRDNFIFIICNIFL